MTALKQVRWQQRFENLQKALKQLRKGIELEQPNDLEVQGIIQSFEFSFELAWKTLKDYLEAQGIQASYPREVIKSAFQHSSLDQGEVWLEMLEKRKLLVHTYEEKLAQEAYELIRTSYGKELFQLEKYLLNQREQQGNAPTSGSLNEIRNASY